MQGRPKGGKNKYYSKEEKIKIVQDMLNDKIKRGYKSQETIFHSDQGIIYSSVAFNNAHKDYNIKRSMSRIGTPTEIV